MTGKLAYIRRDISISFPYLVSICSEWLVKDVPKIRTTGWERNPRTCSNDLSFSFLPSATIWSKMAFINFYKIAKRKIPQDKLISTKTQNLNKQSNSHDWGRKIPHGVTRINYVTCKDEDVKTLLDSNSQFIVTLASDSKHPPMTNSEINQAFPATVDMRACIARKKKLSLLQKKKNGQLITTNTSSLHKEEISPCTEFSSAHFSTGSGSGTTTATRLD